MSLKLIPSLGANRAHLRNRCVVESLGTRIKLDGCLRFDLSFVPRGVLGTHNVLGFVLVPTRKVVSVVMMVLVTNQDALLGYLWNGIGSIFNSPSKS